MRYHTAVPTPTYARRLGLFSGTMVVVGGIIGAGIFLNPAVVAVRVHTGGLTMAVWAAGGVVALLGAFIYGELGQRVPRAGGGYVYLRDAFGPLPAFLYAWALLLVIATGALAYVAVMFAEYTVNLFGLSPGVVKPLAVAGIVFLTGVNYLGVKPGAITQNLFTLLKLAALALLIGAGLLAAAPALPPAATSAPHGTALIVAFGTALVPVLFTFGGWQQANFIAEEMIHPRRDLPRALMLGVLVVVAVYLLANAAYLRALGVDGLARSSTPAADTMEVFFGRPGRLLISAGIALSTFGFLNLVILVSPRVYQAMAADGLFFPSMGRLHPRHRTPAVALVVQAGWAILLTLTGTYGTLLDYVTFGDWIFFGTTAATLLVARRQRWGEAEEGGMFRAPLYPWSVLLFILAAMYVVAGSVASNPANALKGTLLLALGVPVFLFWRRKG